MCTNGARSDKMSDAFLVLGSEYYALARYSAQAFFMPICATMFHHALEMLLKGYLIRTHTSAELKAAGHNLSVLWSTFKASTPGPALARFDTTISRLDRVESLRYPDAIVDEGFTLHVSIGSHSPLSLPGTGELPQFYVDVHDIDALALSVFAACAVSPAAYFQGTPAELANALPRDFMPTT